MIKLHIELEIKNEKTTYDSNIMIEGFFDIDKLINFLLDDVPELNIDIPGHYCLELKLVEFGTGVGKDSDIGYEVQKITCVK